MFQVCFRPFHHSIENSEEPTAWCQSVFARAGLRQKDKLPACANNMCSLGTKNLKNLHQCVPREHTHFPNPCHNPLVNGAITCFRNWCTPSGLRPRSAAGARVYDPQQHYLRPLHLQFGNRNTVTQINLCFICVNLWLKTSALA